MSCYHPKLVELSYSKSNREGKPSYNYLGNPNLDQLMYSVTDPDSVLIRVPCGHCLGCRLDYSRSWADRMMLELETSKKAIFVTLTYNDDHVPKQYDDADILIGYTLDKRDCQLFMKNLRRDYDGKDGHPYAKIRFYLAGEYGPSTLRPHYHAIIFGLSLDDFPLKIPKGTNELNQQYWIVPELENCWKDEDGTKGFVLASDVSWETCAYVARYVMKKAFGNYVPPDEYGFEKEFVLMSRRPGLGKEYLDEHPGCLDLENIPIATDDGSKKIQIPKYYLNQLKLTEEDRYDKIIEKRKKFANDSVLKKLKGTSLNLVDQLEVEEKAKARSIAALSRSKV